MLVCKSIFWSIISGPNPNCNKLVKEEAKTLDVQSNTESDLPLNPRRPPAV